MAWLVLAAFNKAYSENSRWKNRTRKGVMNSIEVVGRADEEAVIVKDLSAIKENLCTLNCTDRNGALNKDPRVNCANSSKKRVPKQRQPRGHPVQIWGHASHSARKAHRGHCPCGWFQGDRYAQS